MTQRRGGRASWWYDSITIRQRAAIRKISRALGIKFCGRFKGEAMGFIGEHYELAKKILENDGSSGEITNRMLACHLLEEVGPWEKV